MLTSPITKCGDSVNMGKVEMTIFVVEYQAPSKKGIPEQKVFSVFAV